MEPVRIPLQENETRLRQFIEHSTNLFYSFTADYLLTCVSPQIRQFLDCEPEDALVKWTDFFTDNLVNAEACRNIQKSFETGMAQPPYLLELIGKKGRRIWVEARESPVSVNGHTMEIVGALTDITARKNAEDEAGLLMSITQAIGTAADFQTALRTALQKVCEATEWVMGEAWLPRLDGRALECGQVWHRNIKSLDKFKLIAERYTFQAGIGLPGRVWKTGRPEWIEDVSNSRSGFLRHDAAESYGLKAGFGIPIIADKKTLAILVFFMTQSHAEDKRMVHVVSSVASHMGAMLQCKITEESIRQSEDSKRRRLEQQLIQAQKMESLGALAGGMAHDFNNILHIIMGHSSLMEEQPVDPARIHKGISAINNAVERGATLTKQLLTFARKTPPEIRPTSINDIISEVVEVITETFPKTIDIYSDLANNLPDVPADRSQIHQVMMNLCVNARDSMSDSGTLSISTLKVDGVNARMRFQNANASTKTSEYIRIDVTDNGPGIDDKIKEKIFDPFFIANEGGKGTGLGLALVHSIVEAHRGFIDVRSETGKGTAFSVFLPVALPVEKDIPEKQEPEKENKK